MYYRRKLILAVLEKAKILGKINLQKILFLIAKKQEKPSFDFIPYKFGCYSLQANKDLVTLCKHYRLIDEINEKTLRSTSQGYFAQLTEECQGIIHSLFKSVDVKNTEQLINKIYDEYPYYTIHSERNLTPQQSIRKKQEEEKINNQKEQELFSIGYEGLTIDGYFNLLIKHNIATLCDVRKNSISMKYGFSKQQLFKNCNNLNIEYIHLPELGIHSDKRKNLKTEMDYQNLFIDYEKTLPLKKESLSILKEIIKKHQRVALTCFEKNHQYCHRSKLIDYYFESIENIKITHL